MIQGFRQSESESESEREGKGKGKGKLMEAKPDGSSHLRMAVWLDEPSRHHLQEASRSARGSSARLSMRQRQAS